MAFSLEIDTLRETMDYYNTLLSTLNEQKQNINSEITKLINDGWSGKSKESFQEKDKDIKQKYEEFVSKVEVMKNILANEIEPKATELRKSCNNFINSFNDCGIVASPYNNNFILKHNFGFSHGSSNKLFLEYEGREKIKKDIENCITDDLPSIKKNLDEILNIENGFKYTSFSLSGEVSNCNTSIKKQEKSLGDFSSQFETYYSRVMDLDNSACGSFGQISGVTNPSVFSNTDFNISVKGIPSTKKIKELMEKENNISNLTDGEKQLLNYIKKLIGEDQYNKIKTELKMDDSRLIDKLLEGIINNKINPMEFQKEKIVISGDFEKEGGLYAKRNFIETAIKQIKEWKEKGEGDLTWMVVKSGYSDKDIELIEKAAEKYGVNLKYIESSKDLIGYINNGKNRDEVKITDISVFSHGLRNDNGTLALDYLGSEDMNITSEEIKESNISRNAFSNVHTYFGACNIGTVQNETSFALEWVKKTGGEAEAVCDPTPKSPLPNPGGQTSYKDMNLGREGIWNLKDKINRNINGINFDIDGSENYPTLSKEKNNSDIYWTEINEDGSVNKIEEGGPR